MSLSSWVDSEDDAERYAGKKQSFFSAPMQIAPQAPRAATTRIQKTTTRTSSGGRIPNADQALPLICRPVSPVVSTWPRGSGVPEPRGQDEILVVLPDALRGAPPVVPR